MQLRHSGNLPVSLGWVYRFRFNNKNHGCRGLQAIRPAIKGSPLFNYCSRNSTGVTVRHFCQ